MQQEALSGSTKFELSWANGELLTQINSRTTTHAANVISPGTRRMTTQHDRWGIASASDRAGWGAVAGDVVRRQQSVGGGTWWGIAMAADRTGRDIATAVVRTRGTYHGSGRDLVGHSHGNGRDRSRLGGRD